MEVFIIIVPLLVYVIIKYLSRNNAYWEKRDVPYVQPAPIVGNCFGLVFQKYHSAIWLWNFYKSTTEPYIGIFLFARPGLIIRSPDLIKTTLVRDFEFFQGRSLEAATGKHQETFSHMLATCSGEKWRNLRAKFSPIFTGSKLREMFPVSIHVGKNMINYLENIQNDIEVKEISDKYTLGVLIISIYGLDIKPFQYEDGEFMKMCQLLFNLDIKTTLSQVATFLFPDVAKILKLKFINPRTVKYFTEAFVKSIEERVKSNIKRNDLIDAVIELKKDDIKEHGNVILSHEEIVAQPLQFLLGGFETSSTTLSFCLYELSKNEDIQNRLKAEIKDAITEDGNISYDQLNNMKYLHMCVSETLRMYPILSFIDRMCKSDYTFEDSGVTINKGTMVIVPVWALHHDPEYHPEPEKFDPERFSDENVKNILPYTYMPFGVGPRTCIAGRFGLLSAKMGLVHILSNFKIIRSLRTPSSVQLNAKSFLLSPKNLFLKFVKDGN